MLKYFSEIKEAAILPLPQAPYNNTSYVVSAHELRRRKQSSRTHVGQGNMCIVPSFSFT